MMIEGVLISRSDMVVVDLARDTRISRKNVLKSSGVGIFLLTFILFCLGECFGFFYTPQCQHS